MQQNNKSAPVPLAGESPSNIQQPVQSIQELDSSNAENINPSQQMSSETVGRQPSADINPPQQVEQAKGDMFNPPPQKKIKSMFIPCCIGCILFLILAFGGLIAFAYFTDTEIPFISDIVEQISSIFQDPKKEAAEATEQVASTLVGAFLPLARENSTIISTFASSSVSKEYIEKYLESYEEIESLRFDLDGIYNVNSENSSDTESNFSLTGSIDFKDESSKKFETTFDIDLAESGTEMYFTGELKGIDNDTYLKLDTYPFIFSSYISSFESQWIKIEGSEVAETAESAGIESKQQEITEEDIENLNTFVTHESVLKNAEILDSEEIEGSKCSCIQLSWNREELKEVMKTYSEIYDKEYDEAEIDERLESIDYLEIQSCIGDDSKMVHRLSLKMRGKTDDTKDASTEINLKLWDYNIDMNITAPNDFTLFEDALNQSLRNYYSNEDYDFYEEFDFEDIEGYDGN